VNNDDLNVGLNRLRQANERNEKLLSSAMDLITEIEEESHTTLNEWEEDFIISLQESIDKTTFISETQFNKLAEIHERLVE